MKQPICIGIDPGFDRVGWAVGSVGSSVEVLAYGCIQTSKKLSQTQRYQSIMTQLSTVLSEHKPTEAALETLYFARNVSTALPVSEARGIILSQLIPTCSIAEYAPGTIKLAVTGHGKATKAAVEKMVRLQLKLHSKPELDDTMDALAVLLTHSVLRKSL